MKCILLMTMVLLLACEQPSGEVTESNKITKYIVTDKSFIAGQNGSGVGITTSGKPVITNNFTNDVFKLLCVDNNGNPKTVKVDIKKYSAVAIGDTISLNRRGNIIN